MRRSSEEGYAIFRWIAGLVTRRYRLFVIVWILVFLGALAANQVWRVGDVVSFSQSSTLPEDTESARAQRIVDEQFPGRLANSSATIVLVAPNVTTSDYRRFVVDLHEAIVSSSSLGGGEAQTLMLQNGATLTIDSPIEFLLDPSSATIYAVYEAYAYELAVQFAAPVHDQVGFTQTAVAIYWGLPACFAPAWEAAPQDRNDTGYTAARGCLNQMPYSVFPWGNAYLGGFYQNWQASFGNTSLEGVPTPVRADIVIAQTVPGFLASPFAEAAFTLEQRAFQLGMLSVFSLANFSDSQLQVAYGLSAFSQVPVAGLPFFEDLYPSVNASATEAELRAFARREVLRYDLDTTPLVLPVDVSRFYISGDRTILLASYEFEKEPGYVDASRRQPITEDVLAIRDLVARMMQAYGITSPVYVTGSAPSSLDQEETIGGGAEFIATIVLAIVLIGLYFRSTVSPAFPILTIAIALMIANLFVYVVAIYLFSVDFTVTAVLQTILLATGTDYSIFLVSRYRDERQDGREKEEAVRNAVIWAGESVTTSGGAVLISFAALSLGSFPILKTMGLTIGFAVTVALGLALTFTPAILMLLGNRVFWPSGHTVARPRPKTELTTTERYFRRAAEFSMKRAKVVLLVAVLITIPSTYIVLTDEPTFDFSAGLPPTESSEGLSAISQSFGYGFIFPSYLIVRFPSDVLLPDGNVSVARLDSLDNLSSRVLAREAGVKSIEGPTNPQGSDVDYRNLSSMQETQRQAILAAMASYIGKDNRTVRLSFVLSDDPFSREAIATVDRLAILLPEIQRSEPELAAAGLYLGGVSAILNDVRDNTNQDLKIMAIVVILGLFIVLLFVLGSVLIPVRAILTILLSISWTLALTIVLFHVWKGLDVVFILPLALFVMAMGLGMDYDIFIITRVREEVARGRSDREAIAEATTRTGGIISACGIIMAGAFATLMLSASPFLQEIGFALAFAILLDSMVVRIYLVPAVMVLAGKYNWWAPGRLQRVRRADAKQELPDIDEL